jgi:hypothetical protein
MSLNVTHTYAILDVSPAAYAEIRAKLELVQYQHCFHKDGKDEVIDMHGIALRQQPEPEPTPHADVKNRERTRAGTPL